MQNTLYVEISIVGICLLMIVLISQRQNIGVSTLQRQFRRLVYATITILGIDAVCWLLDGASFPYARILNIVTETIYYFMSILIPYLWVICIEITLNREQKDISRRMHLLSVPLMLLSVLLFVNLFTNTVFFIDANNIYHRNPGFLAYAALAYVYLVYTSIRTFKAARMANWIDEKRRYHTMSFFIVLPAVGGMIQIFFYGATLIWIFVAVSIVLMYIDALNWQISADPLTGINNRRELTKHLLRETKDRIYKGVLGLIMMDIDDFKHINDAYGHHYGDRVLITVSDLLKQSCKYTPAILARYGGDEFCIVYPAEGVQAVEGLIAEIQSNITKWNNEHSESVSIGLSIGYSVWQADHDDNVESLCQRADQMMYHTKLERKVHAL